VSDNEKEPGWADGLEPKIRDQAVYLWRAFNAAGAAQAVSEGRWANANGGIDIGVVKSGAACSGTRATSSPPGRDPVGMLVEH
jgi:hypothetical protein